MWSNSPPKLVVIQHFGSRGMLQTPQAITKLAKLAAFYLALFVLTRSHAKYR